MASKKTEFDHLCCRGGFLDAQLGKGWSAPFTGYSSRAFRAWIHLCETWYSADSFSRPHVEEAMRQLVQTFQESEMKAVRLAIYGVGNETAMLELWPRIEPRNEKIDTMDLLQKAYEGFKSEAHAATDDKERKACLEDAAEVADAISAIENGLSRGNYSDERLNDIWEEQIHEG